jgi:hypothetical protein
MQMRPPANTPNDICHLFSQYMREGDIDSVLSVYDPGRGEDPFRLHEQADHRSGRRALMHTQWRMSGPEPLSVYAIEVARRQPDGTWRWLIGDPFTVGK